MPIFETYGTSRLDGLLDRLSERIAADAPGLVVGMAQAQREAVTRSWGRKHSEGDLIGAASPLRIGSITKQFTAYALLSTLGGKASELERSIGDILPQLAPAVGAISLRQLLSHQSGLPDAGELAVMFGGLAPPVRAADILEFYSQTRPHSFQPGQRYAYNNGGYTLVSFALEALHGRPFADIMRDIVFSPLGMDRSATASPHSFAADVAPPHAFDTAADRFTPVDVAIDSLGAGAAISTCEDLLKWASALQAGLHDPNSLWSSMVREQKLRSGCLTSYGLGVSIGAFRGLPLISHSGALMGVSAHLAVIPSLDLAVAVIANRDDIAAAGVVDEILASVVGGTAARPKASHRFDAGVFVSDRGTSIVVERSSGSDGTLDVEINAERLRARICDEDRMQLGSIDRTPATTIEMNSSTGLLFHNHGDSEQLAALSTDEETVPPAGCYQSMCGRYHATVDALRLATSETGRGDRTYALEPLAPRLFRAVAQTPPYWNAAIRFDETGSSFTVSTLRTTGVLFERAA